MAIAGLRKLCTPAYVYLVFSLIAIVVLFFQNVGNVNIYCMGSYNCSVYNTPIIFLLKIVYVAFWTWILNLMCDAGASSLAWFFVLLPFILMFILLGFIFTSNVSLYY
jgi:hypothetical protein